MIWQDLQSEFQHKLARYNRDYDPAMQLPEFPFSSPGYHTTLKGGTVHRTREGAEYACMLLDNGDPELYPRAFAVIEKILSLQDTDPAHKTYGIWSWFAEEPLSMMSPPDWNWADFVGKELVQILHFHRAKLPADLADRVEKAVCHASQSIIRRDVTPDYTNIHLMGCYVTLMAGAILRNGEILDFGRRSIRRAVENLHTRGGISEYNSPNYTCIAIHDISILLRDCRDDQALPFAREINDALWKMMAEHYHPATGMLSGPHSRSYDDLMNDEFRSVVALGTKPPDYVGAPQVSYLYHPRCPEAYRSMFASLTAPRFLQHTYNRQDGEIATTYLTPRYSVGSFRQSDMWNQRRPLIAYFANGDSVTYLRARFLHDGYDFCSALLTVCQDKNRLLAGLSMASDFGDTHVNLDPVHDGTITAASLVLRLEIGGCQDRILLPETFDWHAQNAVHIGEETLYLQLVYPDALAVEKGSGLPRVRMMRVSGQTDGADMFHQKPDARAYTAVDFVFYEGAPRAVDLRTLRMACLALTIGINEKYPPVHVRDENGGVVIQTQDQGQGIRLPKTSISHRDFQSECRVFPE